MQFKVPLASLSSVAIMHFMPVLLNEAVGKKLKYTLKHMHTHLFIQPLLLKTYVT